MLHKFPAVHFHPSITDGLKHTTRFGYDAQGNVIRSSDALGNVAQAHYDPANRLIESINPKGRSTTYTYGTLDRLLNRSDALGGTTQLSYDANDNLVQATDRKGQITLQYDALNRPSQISDADGRISVQLRHSPPSAALVATMHRLSADLMITHPMVPLTCVVF